MSLLAPLFALGAVTIGLPILFHLIQRRPKGQTEFSSLMFLTPSPPRLTRRSRLDNILLLLLRAACILLLAMAFARPFLRSAALLGLDTPSRRIVLLVDTSASMRRQDLWKQATKEVHAVVNDLQPTDQFSLMTFDTTITQQIGFDDLRETPGSRRGALIKKRFKDVRPTWYSTNLGHAVVAAADVLETADESPDQEGVLPPQIILVSDMQSGCQMTELDAYEWPAGVKMDVRVVAAPKTTNASLRLLRPDAGDQPSDELRVRVSNAKSSSGEQFRLGWSDSEGKLQGREYSVHVQAGQSRVVRLEQPSATSTHLRLVGDDDAFDNSFYLTTPKPHARTLLYLGEAAENNREGLLHYLSHVSLDTAQRTVTLDVHDPQQPIIRLDPRDTPMTVIADALPVASTRAIRRYLAAGGRALVVIQRQANLGMMREMIQQLTDADDVSMQEAEVDDYTMFGRIDFQHPLFQVFDDPRFNDFTKVRFWSHRQLSSSSDEWEVLAEFDNDDPLLVEKHIEDGRLWILTSGWHPQESQLALSTKFVPLIANMFSLHGSHTTLADSYTLGEQVLLPKSDRPTRVQTPDGDSRELRGGSSFAATDTPGIYRVLDGDETRPFAVNLSSDESKTSPLSVDVLEQRGVRVGKSQTMDEIQEQQRQMRDIELERRQNIWRWLIVAVLGLLFVETWLGGWITMRGTTDTHKTAGV